MSPRRRIRRTVRSRRGAVTVEFAFVAPVFLGIIFGLVQASRLFETQNLLSTAAREGARLAAMDRAGMVPAGTTTNDKIEQDVRNFLNASGVDGDKVNVSIVSAAHPQQTFDLDDPDNDFELFKLRVELPFEDCPGLYAPGFEDSALAAEITFRNNRAAQ